MSDTAERPTEDQRLGQPAGAQSECTRRRDEGRMADTLQIRSLATSLFTCDPFLRFSHERWNSRRCHKMQSVRRFRVLHRGMPPGWIFTRFGYIGSG